MNINEIMKIRDKIKIMKINDKIKIMKINENKS